MHVFEDASMRATDFASDETIIAQQRINLSAPVFSMPFEENYFIFDCRVSFKDLDFRSFCIKLQNLRARRRR